MIAFKRTHLRPLNQTQAKLCFTPYAWAKLRYLRDVGPTEVGGFGICDSNNPLLVKDIELVKQVCTMTTLDFDDESIADLFPRQLEAGRSPDQFARVWIHTHPAGSAKPSVVDEDTFYRLFSASDWGAMFILAQDDSTYGRLRFNVGPRSSIRLKPCVDYSNDFPASDPREWLAEYDLNVRVEDPFRRIATIKRESSNADSYPFTVDAADWHSTEWVAS